LRGCIVGALGVGIAHFSDIVAVLLLHAAPVPITGISRVALAQVLSRRHVIVTTSVEVAVSQHITTLGLLTTAGESVSSES